MMPIKIHPSRLGLIMTDARAIDPALLVDGLDEISKKKVKTDDDKKLLEPLLDRTLSAGAKTELMGIAKEYVYGYHKVVTTKFMEKGLRLENDAIELYNSVFFTSHVKNTAYFENDWLVGQPGIIVPGKIIKDCKVAWDLSTFPAVAEDVHSALYEYQGRGYMCLTDTPEFELFYCMLTTPEELRKYEQQDIHVVDHIPPWLRVTRIGYERNMEIEAKIKTKVEVAQVYLQNLVARIQSEHQY
jgi:hypothetical protein